MDNPHRRVVLLLDMDCFYAQCESIRLGLDQKIPLALIQWRSALAVNYPAREFGIKRGDSFEDIREKSQGRCVCIHLPVTLVDQTNHSSVAEPVSPQKDVGAFDPASLVDSYNAEFNQPKEVRERMYKSEKNKMRHQSEGKANLNRYRLASARIFRLIDETLRRLLGRGGYVLERASIDELFIDVTPFCYGNGADLKVGEGPDRASPTKEKERAEIAAFRSAFERDPYKAMEETNVCHSQDADTNEKEVGRALRLGCHISLAVRQAVFQELSFTLSAGISTSKLVSKLASSHGKPAGQAVVFPGAIVKLLAETKIPKARLLGGKLGKRVAAMLPDCEDTLGSIARFLSLDALTKTLGEESGRWVFDACRGIDHEEVRSTENVLPKSITAFKSFQKVCYPELTKWTTLLARDIMGRVEADTARHSRIPKSITVGYTMQPGGSWIAKTVRLPFPKEKDFDTRVQRLVDGTRKVLTERGQQSFIRIGFSAIDFVPRPRVGIDSFFTQGKDKGKGTSSRSTTRLVSDRLKKSHGIECFFNKSPTLPEQRKKALPPETNITRDQCDSNPVVNEIEKINEKFANSRSADEEIAKQLQESLDRKCAAAGDRDEALALELQSRYDREHEVLSQVERHAAKRKISSSGKKTKRSRKLDFFIKK